MIQPSQEKVLSVRATFTQISAKIFIRATRAFGEEQRETASQDTPPTLAWSQPRYLSLT